jgi:hypothetical protein
VPERGSEAGGMSLCGIRSRCVHRKLGIGPGLSSMSPHLSSSSLLTLKRCCPVLVGACRAAVFWGRGAFGFSFRPLHGTESIATFCAGWVPKCG